MFYIITVYDSLNYGSYFQAHALQWELEKYGKVAFVDIHHQNTFKITMKSCTKKLLKLKPKSMIVEFKTYKKFAKAKKSFPLTDINQLSGNDEDVYFFGSDEIWNISREKIKRSKEFFGYGLPEKNRISVAPSINRSTFEMFRDNPYIAEELNKFKAISVRDLHTKEVIERLLGKECALVADPTLMHSKSVYSRFLTEKPLEKYIMIYTYGMMLKPGIKEKITVFAKEKGLKLISVGRWFDFCDKSVAASPEEFLTYMNHADYVFTDTFHGLMFSLIFEKQFLIFPCNNIKVEETLAILELNKRLFAGGDINNYISSRINYKDVTPKVQTFGKKTADFLKEQLVDI